MAAARSASLPDPVSMSARPAVACGRKTFRSPSPWRRQKSRISLVKSDTSREPVRTLTSILSTSDSIARS